MNWGSHNVVLHNPFDCHSLWLVSYPSSYQELWDIVFWFSFPDKWALCGKHAKYSQQFITKEYRNNHTDIHTEKHNIHLCYFMFSNAQWPLKGEWYGTEFFLQAIFEKITRKGVMHLFWNLNKGVNVRGHSVSEKGQTAFLSLCLLLTKWIISARYLLL